MINKLIITSLLITIYSNFIESSFFLTYENDFCHKTKYDTNVKLLFDNATCSGIFYDHKNILTSESCIYNENLTNFNKLLFIVFKVTRVNRTSRYLYYNVSNEKYNILINEYSFGVAIIQLRTIFIGFNCLFYYFSKPYVFFNIAIETPKIFNANIYTISNIYHKSNFTMLFDSKNYYVYKDIIGINDSINNFINSYNIMGAPLIYENNIVGIIINYLINKNFSEFTIIAHQLNKQTINNINYKIFSNYN
jgi:hypothetical protein